MRKKTVGLLVFFLVALCAVSLAHADTYKERVQAFFAKPEYADGAWWHYYKQDVNAHGWGCNAYARDFAYYCWKGNPKSAWEESKLQFSTADEITDGDIIFITKNGFNHVYVVIERLDENRLWTAEGNVWPSGDEEARDNPYSLKRKVRVSTTAYTIQNPAAGRSFLYGYHMPGWEPWAPGQFLTVNTDGMGNVIGSPAGKYTVGKKVSMTAVPNPKAYFKNWEVSGVQIKDPSSSKLEFEMPDHPVAVTARFGVNVTEVSGGWVSSSVVPSARNATITGTFTAEIGMLSMAANSSTFEKPTNVKLHIAYDTSGITGAAAYTLGGFASPLSYYTKSIPVGEPTSAINTMVKKRASWSLSADMTGMKGALLNPVPFLLMPNTGYFYYWTCEYNGSTYSSARMEFRTTEDWGTISNLRVNDPQHGVFNGDLVWNPGIATLSEVGCFISTDMDAVMNARVNNPGSCAVVKDTGLNTRAGSATINYKGPSFGSLGQLQPGNTYYYKMYAAASNISYPIYSTVEIYLAGAAPVSSPPPAQSDTTAPEILRDHPVSGITKAGYSVTVKASDDTDLRQVFIGTWNDTDGIDQAVWQYCDASGKNFEKTFYISIPEAGNKLNTTYHTNAYAVDAAGNKSGPALVADVLIEDQKPVVTSAKIGAVSASGYEVICEASDNVDLNRIVIGTWHDQMSVNDAVWQVGTPENGEVRFFVNVADFGGATNVTYHTNVYAYDHLENESDSVRAGDPYVENAAPVVSETYVLNVTDEGYDVMVAAEDNVQVASLHLESWPSDAAQEATIQSVECSDQNVNHLFHVSTAAGKRASDYYNYVYAIDACGNVSEAAQPGTPFFDRESPAVLDDSYIADHTPEGFDVVLHISDNYALAWGQVGVYHSGISEEEAQYFAEPCEGIEGWVSIHVDSSAFGKALNEYYYVWGYAWDQFDQCSEAVYLGEVYLEEEPPVITETRISNITKDGYDVTVKAADNDGLSSLYIGSWYDDMPEDEEHWDSVSVTGPEATHTFHVDLTAFGGAEGGLPDNVWVYTQAFAYDTNGNINSDDDPCADQFWHAGSSVNYYDTRGEEETLYLPSDLQTIGAEAFASAAGRYFVLPESIKRIEAYAFPQGAIVYLYHAGDIDIDQNAIAGNGIWVEMGSELSASFAEQVKSTSCQYVLNSNDVH